VLLVILPLGLLLRDPLELRLLVGTMLLLQLSVPDLLLRLLLVLLLLLSGARGPVV